MENKNVGWLILGISALVIGIIFLFNNAMKKILDNSCPLTAGGYTCPAYGTINQQTYLSLAIVGILIVIGIMLIFSKPKEKIVIKKFKEKKIKMDLNGLDSKEKEVINILEKENGTIFQAELMEKIGSGKVGLTRLLDKLEAKQLIERKRRGMNNVVVLRD
jgi:uncharacterized membrane protein